MSRVMGGIFGMISRKHRRRQSVTDGRLRILQITAVAVLMLVAVRLFSIQVTSHAFYEAIASDQHGMFKELVPERGSVYLADPKSRSGWFPAAVNKDLTLVYAVPRDIDDPGKVVDALAEVFEMDDDERAGLLERLSVHDDPYEPVRRKVSDEVADRIRALDLPGIAFAPESFRFYPEGAAVSHLLGFVGAGTDGDRVGRYGIEGYWDEPLRGEGGFLEAERDPVGRFIGTAERTLTEARDGDDLYLTIDRTIQYVACEKLAKAVETFNADGGTVVIAEPTTGAVLAMCSVPDYDPNAYSEVGDYSVFNNPAIFTPYEPGSVFKPITMAAAIDAGRVTPNTTYDDTGEVKIGPYTIRNSDLKANGIQTMTQVLEKSLNTGVIFAVQELGATAFLDYVEKFGFGEITGVALDTEVGGDISALRKRGDIWSATASFGQGITVTPLQLVAAFGAIANGGRLMKPEIVREVRHPDGSVDRVEPQDVRQVITKRAATLLSGMLVRVVENGHGKRAAVPGYYVAGKTGTAQVAKPGGGYAEDDFIGSFVGFAPVDDPAFVMAVKIDRPRDVNWAEESAAPLFGDLAAFLLQYMEIPPERPL